MEKKILVVMGRFGDIYMAVKQLKEPCKIACAPEFCQIVYDLFPQHEVIIMEDIPKYNAKLAAHICRMKYPDHKVVSAQQDGTTLEEYIGFRNFQAYQEYHASTL
jgi:hypothetical protein